MTKTFDGIVAVTSDIESKLSVNKTIQVRNLPILGLIDKVRAANWKKDKPTIIYAGG